MSSTKSEPADLVFAEGAEGSFGDVSFPEEAFKPENTRVRISIKIPGDVLAKLRELAEKQHKGYQTVANEILRQAVMEDEVSAMRDMQVRLLRLEGIAERVEAMAFKNMVAQPASRPKAKRKR